MTHRVTQIAPIRRHFVSQELGWQRPIVHILTGGCEIVEDNFPSVGIHIEVGYGVVCFAVLDEFEILNVTRE
jgi:hypothetical protein